MLAESGGVGVAAYGWRLSGDVPARLLLVRGAEHWPELNVHSGTGDGSEPAVSHTMTDGTVIHLDEGGGQARINPPKSSDDVVHPLLSMAAWLWAQHSGRPVLHAGAFATAAGAWLVLAPKEGGKTTLLAQLHRAGTPVVADDLAVLGRGVVMAGPRCLDLREDMAARLGVGRPVRTDRRRVELPPVDAEHPVAGVIELRWGDATSVVLLPPAERLRRLHAARGPRRQKDPAELLDLAVRPYFCLTRSRSVQETADLLPAGVTAA